MREIQQTTDHPVHCAVCINDGKLTRTPAKWLTRAGYCLCEEHSDMELDELKQAVWGRKNAT